MAQLSSEVGRVLLGWGHRQFLDFFDGESTRSISESQGSSMIECDRVWGLSSKVDDCGAAVELKGQMGSFEFGSPWVSEGSEFGFVAWV